MQTFSLPEFYVPWPARRNPHVDAARAHSKAWAQQVGILDAGSIWSERDFDLHDYALLCGYIHPEAPIPELNLMTDWNVWAFYVDDHFIHTYKGHQDRAAAKQYLDRVLVFMPVDLNVSPVPTNPMERALADLWQRTAPSKSAAWRRRIIESTRRLLEAFLWELDNRNQRRISNPIEYIEMRRQVGAALWSADLVEHAMFVEIPERIAETRPMRVLKETFADAVHLRNDIFSYQREVVKQGELTNAVLVVERFLGVDTCHAVTLTNDLLTARLEQFDHTAATELEDLFEEYTLDPQEQASVYTYIRGLQDWQSGAHEWHIQTSRYLKAGQNVTGMGFRSGPTGLGTAAAWITPGSKIGRKGVKTFEHIPYKKVGQTRLPEFYMPFTPKMNPHLEAARQYSREWANRMGLLNKLPDPVNIFIWDEQRFDANDSALFIALASPSATAAEINLNACWMVWGLYTDDYFVEMYGHAHDLKGAKLFYKRLSEFMPVDMVSSSVPLTPVERGLTDLWSTTTKTLSCDERRMFRKFVEDTIGSWLWELSNRIQNYVPDLVDYLGMRRTTVGSEVILALPRARQGLGIQPEIYQTHAIQALNIIASDYAGLNNDILSYQKEIEFEGDIHNAVLVIQNFLCCDLTQAVEITNNLATDRIKQFEYIVANELPLLFENFNLDLQARQQLLAYVEELQHFIYASLRWHTVSGRYKEFELLRSVGSKLFTGASTGLGTSAARILETIGRQKKEVDAI